MKQKLNSKKKGGQQKGEDQKEDLETTHKKLRRLRNSGAHHEVRWTQRSEMNTGKSQNT